MNLEFLQREEFTNQYGETSSHILSELFRYFPIAFGLQKDSVFTAKFGEIIRYVDKAEFSMRNGFSCCLLDGVQKGARRKVYPKHRYHKMACSTVYSKSLLMNVVKTFPIDC